MRTLKYLLLPAFLFCSLCVWAKSGQKEAEALERQVRSLQRSRDSLVLRLNRLSYESVIANSLSKQKPIPIFAIKTVNFNALYDTVPRLGELHMAYTRAYETLLSVLRKHDDYNEIWLNDSIRGNKAEISRRQQAVFTRLSNERDEQYLSAREDQTAALVEQNVALARYLLDYYHSRNMPLPTKDVMSESETRALVENADIKSLLTELVVLDLLITEQKKKQLLLKYGEAD